MSIIQRIENDGTPADTIARYKLVDEGDGVVLECNGIALMWFVEINGKLRATSNDDCEADELFHTNCKDELFDELDI